MTARNKNIPALRFKEFEGKWKTKKLSELLEFKNGINATKEQYGRGAKFINVLDILNNDFITHDIIIGSVDVDEAVLAKYPINYGDILFQRSSETREEVGTACVYLDTKPATFGGFVIRGRKIGEYDPMFLNKLLKTDLSRNAITSKSGGSTRYNVGQETLSSVALPFPSLLEQQKIASFLSAIDKKIRQLTRRKELLEQYKKGVMQQLFSGKLRFKDEKGKAYPKWEEKKLGDVAIITMGQSPSSKSYNNDSIGKLLIQGNADISGRATNPRQWTSEPTKECKIGDLILTVRAPVGSIAKSYHNAYIGRGVCSIRNKKNSNLEYLYQFLFDYEDKWKRIEQGSTFTAVSGSDISSLKLNLPSLPEQQKIASFLSSLDVKMESVSAQIERTKVFKKGLLQKMFV